MQIKLDYDKNNAEVYLGAAIIAYSQALEIALKELAELRGTDDLGWYQDLRDTMIKTAKGTTGEQISIEVDAGAVRFGFQALEASLDTIRVRLTEK
ncbi:hypothetical protein DXT90_07865 [Agrobacterium tumefaciens]|nr:hypothetical protein [Agrobacterium tumefaciens]